MRRTPTVPAFLIPLLTALLLSSPATVEADLDSGEHREQVWFVPRLVGALSIDGSILAPFPLGVPSGYPTSAGFSAGWRHNFDGRGRLSARAFTALEFGSILHSGLEGHATRIGGGAALTFRGISRDWVFGSLALLIDASALQYQAPSTRFGPGDGSKNHGSQFGIGVETTFGSLVVLAPYLFAETGASVTLSRVTIGGSETWEIWGRWILRFEWALPRAER